MARFGHSLPKEKLGGLGLPSWLPDWLTGRDVREIQGPVYIPPRGKAGGYRKELAADIARKAKDPFTQRDIYSAVQAGADVVPLMGEDVGIKETGEYWKKGDTINAVASGLGTVLGVAPVVGDVGGKLIKEGGKKLARGLGEAAEHLPNVERPVASVTDVEKPRPVRSKGSVKKAGPMNVEAPVGSVKDVTGPSTPGGLGGSSRKKAVEVPSGSTVDQTDTAPAMGVKGSVKSKASNTEIPVSSAVDPVVPKGLGGIKAYHATRGTFDKFGPAPEYRGATYLAATPEAAQKGATGGAQDWYATEGPKPPLRMLEVELPNEGIHGLHWTPKETEWFNTMPDKIVGDKALNEAFKNQPKNSNIDWSDIYEHHQIGDRLYEYRKKSPKTYSLEEAIKTGRDIYGRQLPHYQAQDKVSAERLRGEGMRGFIVHDEGGVSIAHIDPETLKIVTEPVAPKGLGIRAYHGSPHSFEEFDISKIGTGEGAQAYGHGLYFAENEGVAKSYRDALANPPNAGPQSVANYWIQEANGNPDEAKRLIKESADNWRANPMFKSDKDLQRMVAELDDAVGYVDSATPNPGHMYEVDINADPDAFLDWDKPLSEQPEIMKKLNDEFIGPYYDEEGKLGGQYVNLLERRLHPMGGYNKEAATKRMSAAGIPGIKYLDAGSRTAGDGSRNYVVFDPKLISIVKKYGLAAAIASGLISEEMGRQMQQQGEL